MNTAKLITLGLLRGSGTVDPSASFTATTTGAQTLTINGLTVSASTTVDWGDGSSNDYTGSGSRTHNYAGAGTWTVRIIQPLNVTVFNVTDSKFTSFNTAQVAKMLNITDFRVTFLTSGVMDFSDLSALHLTGFGCASTGGTFSILFNAATLLSWPALAVFLMQGNSLSQSVVDAVLIGLNSAGVIRTVTGGTANISGTNAAPSGAYAEECPVITGLGARHNLLNNGCGTMNAGRVWTSVITS